MDDILIDLHSSINNLGNIKEGKFVPDVDTTICLRDILKCLRKESKELEVRLELGKFNFIKNFLIPIVKRFTNIDENPLLFDISIRLLLNLTQPAVICFKQELNEDISYPLIFTNVDEILKSLKLNLADKDFLAVLANYVSSIFEKEWDERSEEDHVFIERILILIRNITHINTSEMMLDGLYTHQDKLILSLYDSGWMDVIIYLSNSEKENRFSFHALEIITLIFREQKPENIIFDKNMKSEQEKTRELELERKIRQEQIKKLNCARSARFNGSFQLVNIKAKSGRSVIYHHDITSEEIDLEKDRKLRKTPKSRVPMRQERVIHQSNEIVVEKLKTFCEDFLEHGFNNLMQNAKDAILRNSIQADDETYYLWSLKFFLTVCRLNRINPEYVSSAVNCDTFRWVYEQVQQYMDSASVDAKKRVEHYKKLAIAMSVFKELLKILIHLSNHKNKEYQNLSARIKCGVFYQQEYLDLYPTLLSKFHPTTQNRALLRDLIDGAYLMIKILQNHKLFDMNVVRKLKKKRKKVVKKLENSDEEGDGNGDDVVILPSDNAEELLLIWGEVCDDVKDMLTGDKEIGDDLQLPSLYDPLLPDERVVLDKDDVNGEPIDAQLAAALGLVQLNLRVKNISMAVSIFRHSQMLWPEEERIVMSGDDVISQELELFKSLLLAKKIYRDTDAENIVNKSTNKVNPVNDVDNEAEDNDEEDEIYASETEVSHYIQQEEAFNFDKFLRLFTHPKIIHSFNLLLEDYATNPQSTNVSLVHLLHRLTIKMKYHSLLYSLRNLNTYNTFLKDPQTKTKPFQELRKFISHILCKFMTDVQENPKIFIECLFDRTTNESMDMVTNYENAKNTNQGPWNHDLDEELERLFVEYNTDHESMIPGTDVVTLIENSLSDNNKTRRQIIGRLVTLGLINSVKDLKIQKSRRNKKEEIPWSSDERRQLIVLVDEYRYEKCPIKDIMNALKTTVNDESEMRSRKSVVKMILELSLVEDEEALGIRKQRRRPRMPEYECMPGIIGENLFPISGPDDKDPEEVDDDNFIRNLIGNVQNYGVESNLNFGKRQPPPMRKNRQIDWWGLKKSFAEVNENERSWFVEMLTDMIESRRNGIVGDMAIIPLDDSEVLFLSNPIVERILGVCEFLPPNPEAGLQFWRIPELMDEKEIEYFKNCVQRLSKEEMDKLLGQEAAPKSDIKEADLIEIESEEESGDDVSDKEDVNNNNSDSDEEYDEHFEKDADDVSIRAKSKSKMRILDSDISEDEEENETSAIDKSGDDDDVPIRTNNKSRMDLESEIVENDDEKEEDNKENRYNMFEDDDDLTIRASNKSKLRILESDDEDELDQPIRKRPRLMNEDNESD